MSGVLPIKVSTGARSASTAVEVACMLHILPRMTDILPRRSTFGRQRIRPGPAPSGIALWQQPALLESPSPHYSPRAHLHAQEQEWVTQTELGDVWLGLHLARPQLPAVLTSARHPPLSRRGVGVVTNGRFA